MTLLQAHYTSCREGLGSGSGFQFCAASEALKDRLAEIERIVLYQPPPGSPAAPSDAQIDAMPVRLQYRQLYDGTRVLSRSRYLGRDYTERFGNFFTHVIVLDDIYADLGERLPVDLLDLPLWVERETGSKRLPDVQLPAPTPDGLASALQLLHEPGRIHHVPAFAEGLIGAVSGGRRVVVVDEPAAATAWIQLASRCLPPALRRELAFSSFEAEPRRSDVALAVTVPGTDVGFAAYELASDVTLIDVVGADGAHDGYRPAAGLYGQLVAFMVYREDAEAMRAFGPEATDRLAEPLLAHEAGAALALHVGAEEGLSGSDLRSVLDLLSSRPASRFGTAELEWVFDQLPEDEHGVNTVRQALETVKGKPGHSADALRELGLSWFVTHRALALSELPTDWRRPPVAPGAELVRRWVDTLEGLNEAEFIDALDLGTRLQLQGDGGMLAPHASRIAAVAWRRTDDRSAAVVAELPASTLAAIAPLLAGNVNGKREKAARLQNLLATDGMRRAILQRAEAAEGFRNSLQLWCLYLEAERNQEAAVLRRLGQRAEIVDEVQEAVDLTFSPSSPTSAPEAADMLDALRGCPLPEVLRDRAVKALTSERLADFSREAERVLGCLKERGVRPTVAEAADTLSDRTRTNDAPAWCRKVLALLKGDGLGQIQVDELERALTKQIVQTAPGHQLARLLGNVSRECCSLDPALARNAQLLLGKGDSEHAAALFEATLARDSGLPALEAVVCEHLAGWKDKERQRLASYLSSDTAREAWEAWEQGNPAPVSSLKRLMRRGQQGRNL